LSLSGKIRLSGLGEPQVIRERSTTSHLVAFAFDRGLAFRGQGTAMPRKVSIFPQPDDALS
jgi:hypothetical protein